MNTTSRIFHHLRADFQRHWLLFALLVIGLGAFAVIDYRLLFRESRGFFPSDFVAMTVFGLGCLLAFFIIQADPPVGTSPFWKTRPLRGKEIFFSKSIQILLIGLLMFIGWNAAPFFSGAPGALILSYQAIIPPILLGVVAVAAVSRSLFQALVVGGILWAGVATMAWLSDFTQNHSAFDKTVAMRSTGALLAGIVLSIGAIAITFSQYLRTRQVIGIAAFSIILIMAFFVMKRSTADLITVYLSPAEQHSLGVANAAVRIDPDPKTFQRGSHTIHTPTKTFHFYQFSGKTTIAPLPEGVFASMTSIKGELHNPDTGETFPSLSRGTQSRPHSQISHLVAHDFDILEHSSRPSRVPDLATPFLQIASSRYPSETAALKNWRYEGIASVLLARMEPVQTVPFGEKAVIHQPGLWGAVSSNLDGAKRIQVQLILNSWRAGNHDRTPAIACLVVNRQRNEALSATGSGSGISANRHRSTESSWSFNRNFWRDGNLVDLADDWLDNAEVILYREQFLGTIQRPATMDPLTLPGLNPHLSNSGEG